MATYQVDLENGSSYEVEVDDQPTSPILQRGDLIHQKMRENVARTEQQISQRPSSLMKFAELYGRKPSTALEHPVGTALNTLGAGWEVAESSVANPILGLMRGVGPNQILEDVSSSLIGQRPAQIGDVFRYQGFPEPAAAVAGLGTAAPTLIPNLTRLGVSAAKTGARTVRGGFNRLLGKSEFTADPNLIQASAKDMAGMSPAERERAFQLQKQSASAPSEQRISDLNKSSQQLLSPLSKKSLTLKERIAQRISEAKRQRELSMVEVEARASASEELVRKRGETLIHNLEREKSKLESALTQRKYGIARVIQSRFSGAMKKAGDHYRSLYDKGIELSQNVRISADEARASIEEFASKNPEVLKESPSWVDDVMEQLGFVKGGMAKLTDAQGRPFVVPAGTISEYSGKGIKMPSAELSVPDILGEIRNVRGKIPVQAKAGSRMYTHSDMMADNVAEALRGLIRSKAPKEAVKYFDDAGLHWAEWKPISREALSEFEPFTRQPIGLKGGMNILEEAASAKDPNSVRFIGEIEKYMEIPKGSLSSDIKNILSSVDDVEKRLKVAKGISNSPELKRIHLNKSREMEMIEQKFAAKESLLNKRLSVISRAVGNRANRIKKSTQAELESLNKEKMAELGKVQFKYQNAKHIVFQRARAMRRVLYTAGVGGIYGLGRDVVKSITGLDTGGGSK